MTWDAYRAGEDIGGESEDLGEGGGSSDQDTPGWDYSTPPDLASWWPEAKEKP